MKSLPGLGVAIATLIKAQFGSYGCHQRTDELEFPTIEGTVRYRFADDLSYRAVLSAEEEDEEVSLLVEQHGCSRESAEEDVARSCEKGNLLDGIQRDPILEPLQGNPLFCDLLAAIGDALSTGRPVSK